MVSQRFKLSAPSQASTRLIPIGEVVVDASGVHLPDGVPEQDRAPLEAAFRLPVRVSEVVSIEESGETRVSTRFVEVRHGSPQWVEIVGRHLPWAYVAEPL